MKKNQLLVAEPTIGSDIEVFLKDKETDEIVSAEGIIKGTKDFPFRFKEDNPYFATSLDNVMAEFCIPPAKKPEEFISNINEALEFINLSIPQNLTVLAIPAANINEIYLQTENAKLFGCDPDYNAWKFGNQNPRPEAITNLRSCGGHIHIGYKEPEHITTMNLIKAMDVFIGLPSIIQEPENERKSLYGKAGAFRFKDYGGEYRTVSNYYINSPHLMNWIFENTLSAIDFTNNKVKLSVEESEGIQAAINFNNKELAKTLCTYFGVKLAA
jgi:Phage phiEco32-like COOH.NH2 ligase-type 2